MAVDPDVDEVPELGRLLATLGLEARYEPILSERSHASLKRALSDRRYLASNRFTSHDSLSTLSKRSSRDHVLFDTTGWLSKAKETAEGASEAKVTFIIKAPSGSWNDVNGDYEFDKDVENKKAYNLIAAVELAQPEGSEMPGGKAIVSADADVIGDFWLPISRGNAQLAIDTVRWLEGETELAAEVAAIEDVKIVHTKDEDKLWFYSTTLGMPILLLALGAGLNRSRRRRMES